MEVIRLKCNAWRLCMESNHQCQWVLPLSDPVLIYGIILLSNELSEDSLENWHRRGKSGGFLAPRGKKDLRL